MKSFSYRAVDRNDQMEQGIVEARDETEAGRRLLDRGLFPLDVTTAKSLRDLLNSNIGRVGPSNSEVAQLLYDVGQLVVAGVEIATALALVQATSNSAIRETSGRLLDHLRKGRSFSDAIRQRGHLFPNHVIAVVVACETSNALGDGLIRIAEAMRQSAQLRSRVQTAMIYPACIAIAVCVAIAVLLTVVVPTLEGLFADQLMRLPWQTRLVVAASNFMRQHMIGIVVSLIGCGVILVILWCTPGAKIKGERLALRLPLLGDFIQATETAQIATMIAMLTSSGVPVVDAVFFVRGGTRFLCSQIALDEALIQLRSGKRLHEALDMVPTLSSRAVSVVRIGETTGRLGPLLEEAAREAQRRVAVITDRVLAILPPAMTLVFGVVAGFVLFAVTTAILSVNSLAARGG